MKVIAIHVFALRCASSQIDRGKCNLLVFLNYTPGKPHVSPYQMVFRVLSARTHLRLTFLGWEQMLDSYLK